MQTTGSVFWEIGDSLVDALMRSGPIVVGLIFLECSLELPFVKEQKMIGAFALQSST